MKGENLYKKLSKRDYSGSESDLYAQELTTMFFYLKFDLFPLLEKAEKQGKKLAFKKTDSEDLIDDYFIEDIELV